MTNEEFKKIRQVVLRNAEDLIKAAKCLATDLDHVRYHLAALALEEVGKADLLGMKFVAGSLGKPTGPLEDLIEDHVKKLFWALWGPSFGKEKITKDQIELTRRLATRIHETRLHYLYADPYTPLLPEEKVNHEEVEQLVSLAEARIGLESAHELSVDESRTEQLQWFLNATDNPEKRKLIFAGKSMEKLAELGDTKEWIKWLKETFDKHDAEIRQLVESELRRERPEGEEAQETKWRIRVRIYSHSHSIRQKALNEWNNVVESVKLTATGKKIYSAAKKDELICEFTLPKSVPAEALWHHGWGISRAFVTALNIGTRGFFWWYVPRDTDRYYEEIWDVETNAGIRVEPQPRLELNWGNLILEAKDMGATSMVLGYLLRIRGQAEERPFNSYITGLTFLSKIDWHFRFEVNAFEQFFEAFKEGLRVNGYWDGTEDLKSAAGRRLRKILGPTEGLEKHLDLGLQLQIAKEGKGQVPGITLTEVIGMKLYGDLYFTMLARAAMERDKRAQDGEAK